MTTSAQAFGFEIPQGSVGDIEAASRQAGLASAQFDSHAQNVRGAAQVATARWSGRAQSSFLDYAAHLIGVFSNNCEVLARAGTLLSELALELDSAQQVTRQAAQQCASCQQEAQTQQELADQHARNADDLHAQAAVAVHPQVQAELTRQARAAEADHQAAADAAGWAQDELSYWQRRGQDAFGVYTDQATRIARQITALEEDLRPAVVPHGGVPIPAAAGHRNGELADAAAVSGIPAGLGLTEAYTPGKKLPTTLITTPGEKPPTTLITTPGEKPPTTLITKPGKKPPSILKDPIPKPMSGLLTHGPFTTNNKPHKSVGPGLDRGDGRDPGGKFTGKGGYGASQQEAGLKRYEKKYGQPVVREEKLAKIPGFQIPGYTGRKYDGLAPNDDNKTDPKYDGLDTYTGIEIKSGNSPYNGDQREFDDQVRSGKAAVTRLNGKEIWITEVEVIRVK